MPRSDDPYRHGGRYAVYWIDDKGKKHSTVRATKGQARQLMRHKKDQGLVSWIKPL
jgi:hypothetical protein